MPKIPCRSLPIRYLCIPNASSMVSSPFPTYGICHLTANKSGNDLLNADRFSEYLSVNPHLQVMHRHTFYHLLYFTEGSGSHTVDFVRFPVQEGMVYFMKPGQVHVWDFQGPVDGYIINFSPTFFDRLSIGSQLLERFAFFGGKVEQQVVVLDKTTRPKAERILQEIIQEQLGGEESSPFMVAALLLQFFLTVERAAGHTHGQTATTYNGTILQNFERLVEEHFRELRLPKEYAALLYITPNHLNALCKDVLGLSAGEIIRNRVVLEAKRLLVNPGFSVGDVARELHFADVSYFVKFFKKYTDATPEVFRKTVLA